MDESEKDDPCDDVSGKNSLEGWIKVSEKITTKNKNKEKDYPSYPGIEFEDSE